MAKPIHVLLIEDRPIQRQRIAMLLERKGYKVTVVENHNEADTVLSFAESAHPVDIIVSDNEAGSTNGIYWLQQRGAASLPPVILYSADDGVREQALSAGARAFIMKNMDVAEEIDVIIRKSLGARAENINPDNPPSAEPDRSAKR